MTSSKKNISLAEVPRKSVPSVGEKRSAEVLEEEENERWIGVLRSVFVTYGHGELSSVTLRSGKTRALFEIKGTYADNESALVMAWGADAEIFAKLFKRFALPDAPTLWAVPPLAKMKNQNGKFFRLGSANDFQVNKCGTRHTLVLNYPIDFKGPYDILTKEAFPSPYNWGNGRYVLNGKIVPHYSTWGITEPQDDLSNYNPVAISFAEASPQKAPRAESSSLRSRGADDANSKLSFDDED